MKQKNVLIFYTDQQRADSLGCMGNTLAQTPNLDKLAAEGTRYTNHYASNPVCMPSRASFFTGRHLQAHRVIDNGFFLPETELTMPEVFRQNNYTTLSIGKIHLQPTSDTFDPTQNISMENTKRWNQGELDDWTGPYYGFEEVKLSIGHGENGSGHYGRWRTKHFPDLKIGPDNAQGKEKYPEIRSYKSNMPLEAHHSTWITDNTLEFLENYDSEKPFFLFVSFPDPHVPFTPPAPYHSLYDDIEFPFPYTVEGENETKPFPYKRAMTNNPEGLPPVHNPALHGAAYQQMMAHTYGMIKLIDDSIGRIMNKMNEKNLTDNTLIMFSSDHGDYLGDHSLFCKSPLPSRSLLNIPLIIRDPDDKNTGSVDAPCSNVDIMPTLLSKCGIEIPDTVQGNILPNPGEKPSRDYAYCSAWSKYGPDLQHYTIYKQDYRLSILPHLNDGELYNLIEDPHEHNNLFHESACKTIKTKLMEELLFAVGQAEPENPGNPAKY